MAKDNIFNIVKKIKKEQKNAENYNTGLVGEQLIVASYKTMELDKLEKLRYILNKIIKQKKEYIRFNKYTNDKSKSEHSFNNSNDNSTNK